MVSIETPKDVLILYWKVMARLVRLLVWTWIALAHVAALAIAGIALSLSGTTGQELAECARQILDSRLPVVLGVSGVSVATAVYLYWRLARWVHKKVGSSDGRLYRYLSAPVRD